MDKIEIRCGGGIGNRLSTVIGGLEIAKICNLQPIINWCPAHSCFAKFYDLFDSSIEVEDDDINLPILYSISDIPEYLDLTSVIQNLLQLRPKKKIIDNVSNFVSQNNINSNVIGIHIRKTDCDTNEGTWIDLVSSNPNKRFFICSDSQETENKFATFSNTIILPKNEYVTKRFSDQPWRMKDFTYKGHPYEFNVSRSTGSIIEALQDLLILSHTDIQTTSEYSSFLHLAKYYNTILEKIMN